MAVIPEEYGFIPEPEVSLERPVLRDRELQEEFDRVGYVVVPLISEEEVQVLRAGYLRAAESAEGVNAEGAYNELYAEFSVIHSRPAFRKEAFSLIGSVLTPAAHRYLLDYRPLVANFVNKPPGTGVVPAHQNWSVVDESKFQSVSVWVALVDCTLDNGTMLMCDGSHRTLRGRRGMWAYQAFTGIESDLIEEHLTPVEVKAGDAIILDDAVVHYSPPNLSDAPRLAIQFVMVPDESDALFHQQVGAHGDVLEVDVWRVEEGFFFNFWHGDGDEHFGEVVDRIEVRAPLLNADQFDELIGGRSSSYLDSVGDTSAEPTGATGGVPDRPQGSGGRWRRLLRR